jgi:hypothetical protein
MCLVAQGTNRNSILEQQERSDAISSTKQQLRDEVVCTEQNVTRG